ncbi:MAG: DHH family phosphoesterase [Desulfurococcaceae archaeon]|jgi:oligoribonuclease NrnB/cAMP/cGMP phosphodiesterase (DHH superfamily)
MDEILQAIVAHTDIDGVASAALYVYLAGVSEYRLFFTEPFRLAEALDKVSSAYYEKVVILDLGINPPTYSDVLRYLEMLKESDIEVAWFDHHVWNDEWLRDVSSLGVKLYVDTSTCTTGVVAKHVTPLRDNIDYSFVDNLVKGVCAGDLWKYDHWLGGYYVRLVRRKDRDSWRKKVVEVISSGNLWVGDFDAKVEEHIDAELKLLSSDLELAEKSVKNTKIVAAMSSELVENSFLAAYIMGRYGADVVVLVSRDGKLSFRSRKVNVRDLALALGGGGHLYASGAKIKIPWFVRAFSKIKPRLLLNYVLFLISKKLSSTSHQEPYL